MMDALFPDDSNHHIKFALGEVFDAMQLIEDDLLLTTGQTPLCNNKMWEALYAKVLRDPLRCKHSRK
jgi:hypothetical protein